MDVEEFEMKYPEFYKGLVKYERHLRHSRPALVHAAPAVVSKLPEDVAVMPEVAAPVRNATATPMALPGRFPAVEKALGGMDDDLRALKEKQLVAKQVRGELEGSVAEVTQHMNDAMGIKHAMAKKEAELRIETGKLHKLENDFGRLGQTHDGLVSSLRRMLMPKMMIAKKRFEKKEAFLRKEENNAKAWKDKSEQVKTSAMALVERKKASHKKLLEAEAAVAEARKAEKLARIQYEHDAAQTSEEVQSFRYAETRYKAELHHENLAKAEATRARETLDKLHNVFEVEEQKVEQSVGYREHRLRRKMHDLEAARQKSTHDLDELGQKYREWKESQSARAAAVVKKGRETAAASEEYANRQKKVLDAASAKVAREAESGGDWDDWGAGSEFTKLSDEQDDDSDDN